MRRIRYRQRCVPPLPLRVNPPKLMDCGTLTALMRIKVQ